MAGNKTLRVGIIADDQLSKHIQRIQKELFGLERKAKQTGTGMTRTFRAVLGPIRSVLRSVFSLRTAFVALGAAWAGMRFADAATRLETLEHGFGLMSKRIGSEYLPLMETLRRATKGTVSDLGLMEIANKGVMMGAVKTADQLETLVWSARRLGRVMGLDVGHAIDRLIVGLSRMSYRVVDDVGVTMRLADAKRAYAAAIGKTVDELTAEETQQAFTNEFLRKAGDLMRSLGKDTDFVADKWQRFKATLQNFWQDFQRAMLPVIGDISEKLTTAFKENRQAIFDWLAGLAEAAYQVLPSVLQAVRNLITELQVLWSPFKDIAVSIVRIREAAADVKMESVVRRFTATAGKELGKTGTDIFYKQDRSVLEGIFGVYPRRETWEAAGMFEELIQKNPRMLAQHPVLKRAYDEFTQQRDEFLRLGAMRRGMEGGAAFTGEVGPQQDPFSFLLEAAKSLRIQGRKQRTVPKAGTPEGAKPGKDTVEELSELQKVLDEIGKTVDDVGTRFRDNMAMAKNSVLDTSDALVNNLGGGFHAIITAPHKFEEAVEAMARGVLDDLAKILTRMVAIRLVGFGLGAISGLWSGGASAAAVPAAPIDYRVPQTPGVGLAPMAQHGGVFDRPYIGAERPGAVEAAVPLPGNRRIPVEFIRSGGAEPQQVTVFNISTIDAKSFDEYFRDSAGRNPEVVGYLAMRQFQDSKVVRRGMRG